MTDVVVGGDEGSPCGDLGYGVAGFRGGVFCVVGGCDAVACGDLAGGFGAEGRCRVGAPWYV